MSPKYKLIEAFDRVEFHAKVQSAMNEGWQCQGGVSISFWSNSSTIHYAQAMVR